jgi:flavodoxin
MNEVVITVGLISLIGLIFYFLVRQNNRQLKNINETVQKEAKTKGLQIKSIIYPDLQEWKKSPFEREIKIGTLGFEGIPYNREYYRILKCKDSELNEKTIWVRVTRSYKTGELTLEWKDEN